MTLTYNDAAHRYRLDGRAVPNVTTILSGGIPKPALVGWAAKVVAEAVADMPSTVDEARRLGRDALVSALQALPNQTRDAAAARGTEVHALAEKVVTGYPVDVPEALAGMVQGYADWLDRAGFLPLLVEHPVASRTHWYAGRFDLIGTLGPDLWLLDVKTSRSVYGDTACQLAAYARAEFYVSAQGHETPMPQVARMGVLHVQDGATDLYDLGDINDAFDEFLSARHIYATASRRRRLVGEPVEVP